MWVLEVNDMQILCERGFIVGWGYRLAPWLVLIVRVAFVVCNEQQIELVQATLRKHNITTQVLKLSLVSAPAFVLKVYQREKRG